MKRRVYILTAAMLLNLGIGKAVFASAGNHNTLKSTLSSTTNAAPDDEDKALKRRLKDLRKQRRELDEQERDLRKKKKIHRLEKDNAKRAKKLAKKESRLHK